MGRLRDFETGCVGAKMTDTVELSGAHLDEHFADQTEPNLESGRLDDLQEIFQKLWISTGEIE